VSQRPAPDPHVVRARTHGDDTVRALPIEGLPAVSARAKAPRRVKVLAMRLYWNKKPPAKPTTKQAKKVLSDSAAWFKTISRGRHTMGYALTPWLKVSAGAGTMCNFGTNGVSIAVKRAKRAGFKPASFTRFMLLMPQCRSNSLGEMPGRVTWIRQVPDVDVIVHELGHNLGLDHANSRLCKQDGRAVTWSKKCYEEEYGDVWDAMGVSSQPYSTPILARLGWAGKIKAPRGSGTFTLKPLERFGAGTQAVKVKAGGRTYWLEYRTATQPLAAVDYIKGKPGLQVRVDLGRKSMYLLDAAPGDADPYLIFPSGEAVIPALPAGASFTTPEKVRIQVVSQTAKALKVKITRGYRAKAPSAPRIQWALRSDSSGQTTLRVLPPKDDGGQLVIGYRITRLPSGKTKFVKAINGGDGTFTVSTGSKASYKVQALNQVGWSAKSAAVESRKVAPTVRITSPASGASITGHTLAVTAEADPDPDLKSPIDYVRFCLQTTYQAEHDTYCGWSGEDDYKAPYAHTFTDLSASDYVLRVEAWDRRNNLGVATRPVTVLGYSPTVTITSPASGATLDAAFHVTGTTAPHPTTGSPVEYVSVQLWTQDGDQVWADDVDGLSSFDATFTHVPRGTHTLDVTASTADGEYRTVRRPVTVAYARPTWTILKPVDGATLSGSDYVEFESVVTRPDRLQEYAYAEILVNGESWGIAYPDFSDLLLDPGYLSPGTNTVSLVVNDDGGFGTWTADTATVTYSP